MAPTDAMSCVSMRACVRACRNMAPTPCSLRAECVRVENTAPTDAISCISRTIANEELLLLNSYTAAKSETYDY
jgi:hypothetical protein